ncbi:MAG TPA: carboxylesterase/lipase family protein [Candidatus Lustribacter sp.]|nr:carboxylesterase/lipase family protein [Candidatus Lustribacter sp.]
MSDATLDVECDAGTLRGTRDRGALVFRNIPFAAPPVGDMRFEPPQDPQPWTGIRDATRNGPIAPQGRSRLADVMGDFSAGQSEDCLTLNVWTPAADAKQRPVLVFIHGGGFSSGAGSLPWYSGHVLAVANDIVVVTVNYRLGALGYLYLPGVSPGNLGLLDNVAALRWVQRNIARFGGDPLQVTVSGQSAGAMSTLAMMTSPAARGLFRRAISQSAAFGSLARTVEDAERIGAQFAQLLGVPSTDAQKFKTLPVGALLEASGKLARLRAEFANTSPPFLPTIDGTTIPREIVGALRDGAGRGIDLMIGTTREESAAFCAIDPGIQAATETQVFEVFERVFGASAAEQLDVYKRRRPQHTAQWLLTDIITDEQFLMTMLRVAEERANAGRPAYVYQFDWQSRAQRAFAACHCLELPFVFGNVEDWPDAPMLEGADPAEVMALGRVMVAAWGAFVRTGSPNHRDLPHWSPYEPARRTTMRFDRVTGPVDDLAGFAQRL